MTVTLTGPASETATADLILSARLTADLNRSVIDTPAERLINDGTPSLLAGTIVYLHETLTSALAMWDVYKAGICTLTTETTGEPLDGFEHIAFGAIRIDTTQPRTGQPSRWTLTADIAQIGT